MSAAFGYVDHVILLQRLRSAVGLSGVILNWIDSFLYGHTQEIAYNGLLSTTQYVLFGVPQGLVPEPCCTLCTQQNHLMSSLDSCGWLAGLYQHDSRWTAAAVDQLSTCLVDIEVWLKASRLHLNPAKTQVIWLGSQQLLARLDMATVPVLSSSVWIQETDREFGVVIYSCLSLSNHVAAVCWSGYY